MTVQGLGRHPRCFGCPVWLFAVPETILSTFLKTLHGCILNSSSVPKHIWGPGACSPYLQNNRIFCISWERSVLRTVRIWVGWAMPAFPTDVLSVTCAFTSTLIYTCSEFMAAHPLMFDVLLLYCVQSMNLGYRQYWCNPTVTFS